MNFPRLRTWIGDSWGGARRLYVCQDTGLQHKSGQGQIVKVAAGFNWIEHLEGDQFDPADGIAHADELIQSIMDKAWEAGFRPRGFADIKNETAALREHLADMKAIAFHQLKLAK